MPPLVCRTWQRPHPVLQAERQRIARDLHDQVGSQLVSAIALLDPATPSQKLALSALEQCLLDLRLVVDSMDSSDESLPDRLARLRHRIQPVLQHRGIVLAWEVDCTPHEHLPSGDQAAHLAHIVQEALSNMLQHSGATQVHSTGTSAARTSLAPRSHRQRHWPAQRPWTRHCRPRADQHVGTRPTGRLPVAAAAQQPPRRHLYTHRAGVRQLLHR